MSRIFLITPGRSGSYWISALILASTNLPLTGNPEYFSYDKIPGEQERREFLDKIWEEFPEEYVCTSLLPRMGYLEALREKGARFIHLRRNIRDNAYSMYRMHFTPGRGFRGKWYHPEPEATENILRLRGSSNLTDYQLCLWACVETRAVARRIKYLETDVIEIDIDEINNAQNYDTLKKLLDWVGVEYDFDRAKIIVGKKVNVLKRYNKDILPEIEEGVRRQQEKEFCAIVEDLEKVTQLTVRELSSEFK